MNLDITFFPVCCSNYFRALFATLPPRLATALLASSVAGSSALDISVVEASASIFNIGDKDVRVCLACDACKRQHTPNCIQKDDFTALIPEIDGCDAMLILAPVHWYQFPAQLKAFLDRTYSFMDFTQPDFSMASRKDKNVGGYFFAGFGPVDVYTNMVETNIKSFATAGFTEYKAYVAGDANVPGSVMEKEDALKAADEIAEWLVS